MEGGKFRDCLGGSEEYELIQKDLVPGSRKKSEKTRWYQMMEGLCGILYYCSVRFAAPPFSLEVRLAQVTLF